MKDAKRRWLGWVAIGLGALALAVALFGGSFGSRQGFGGGPGAMQQQAGPGANAQPSQGQQNAGPQAGRGAGRQNAGPQAGPGANAQPSQGQQNADPRGGPGGEMRRGGGRPDGGFGIGGWLRSPLRLIGGSFQWAMLALLIGLGVWMLRGRNAAAASATVRAEPAQSAPPAPLSPTGEAYIEEPSGEE